MYVSFPIIKAWKRTEEARLNRHWIKISVLLHKLVQKYQISTQMDNAKEIDVVMQYDLI